MEPDAVRRTGMHRLVRPRRLVEAALVMAIVVAYLLVVSRGQVVFALSFTTPDSAASAALHEATAPPPLGEPAP